MDGDLAEVLAEYDQIDIELIPIKRTVKGNGVQGSETDAPVPYTVTAIPTSPKELDALSDSTTNKEFFSFYFEGPIDFLQNDIIKVLGTGIEYEITAGWKRPNGNYTKIIAGSQRELS